MRPDPTRCLPRYGALAERRTAHQFAALVVGELTVVALVLARVVARGARQVLEAVRELAETIPGGRDAETARSEAERVASGET